MLHRTVVATLCLLLLGPMLGAQGAPAQQGSYRLAGVMLAGDSYLGFLELPQGDQVLVRLGSVVNGGKVVQFDARALRIRFPDRTVELLLEGSGKPPPPAAVPVDVVVSGEQQGHVIRREVDVGNLHSALDDANRLASSSAAGTNRPALSAQQVVTQRFQPLLDLPPDARVVAVNETRVISAGAAIRTVEETLAKGMPARLNLETPQGTKRVYLMPARDGTPTENKQP